MVIVVPMVPCNHLSKHDKTCSWQNKLFGGYEWRFHVWISIWRRCCATPTAWILLHVPFKHPDERLDWDDVEQSVHQKWSHTSNANHHSTSNQLSKDAFTIVLSDCKMYNKANSIKLSLEIRFVILKQGWKYVTVMTHQLREPQLTKAETFKCSVEVTLCCVSHQEKCCANKAPQTTGNGQWSMVNGMSGLIPRPPQAIPGHPGVGSWEWESVTNNLGTKWGG